MVARLLGLLALLALFSAGPLEAAHFDTQYVPRFGQANADGLVDIFLEYRPKIIPVNLEDVTIPITASKADVGEFVLLQQPDGSFIAAVPTAAERMTFRTWQKAPLQLLLSDVDADSNVDLLIRKVSNIAPGANDIIVYAPSASGAQPTAIRPVNSDLTKFIRDLQGWGENHAAYYAGAFSQRTITTPIVLPRLQCPSSQYAWPFANMDICFGPVIGTCTADLGFSQPCLLAGSFTANVTVTIRDFDSVNYSAQAKKITDILGQYTDATTPLTDEAIQAIVAQFTLVLGRPYFPDAAPGTVEWEELGKLLKVLARAGAGAGVQVFVLVAGVLFPSEIADEDVSDAWETQQQVTDAGTADAARKGDGFLYFYHTTLQSSVSSILGGISSPARRNFPGDAPGFYLATNPTWAYAFGRSVFGKFKPWVTIQFRMTTTAHATLLTAGAQYEFHPQAPGIDPLRTTFELRIFPHAYGTFNALMNSGQIVATPLPPFRF